MKLALFGAPEQGLPKGVAGIRGRTASKTAGSTENHNGGKDAQINRFTKVLIQERRGLRINTVVCT